MTNDDYTKAIKVAKAHNHYVVFTTSGDYILYRQGREHGKGILVGKRSTPKAIVDLINKMFPGG